MTKILRSDENDNAGYDSVTQANFKSQIKAQVDALRQLVGRAEIAAGATTNDPLNSPYVLYVNPFTGKDTFVGGSYSTSGTAVQRIEQQRLECGYTQARPFKTINRAVIEAGIITSKSFYSQPLTNNDLVTIVLAPGVYTALNGTGTSVSAWSTGKDPSDAELKAFNTTATGGIILPRGVSLCSLDLRKTIIRPSDVPTKADESGSNRRTIFKVTGTGYYFGFTFMDKDGSTDSHHLLHCFEFASQTELEEFYGKINTAFTTSAGLTTPTVRTAEYEIVGPKPAAGSQTINTDTTLSASPYIFNCSIRSQYGLCGVYADGSKPSGFKSLVVAQFTGVSLQRDLTSWQKWSSNAWGSFADYTDYRDTSPNSVRMNPARRSFHIRAINDAIIQEVSVFAIGQGVHHWTQSGGEITITNSNSNFGGCAAISDGYRTSATTSDSGWNIGRIRVANNLSDLDGNVRRIYLGTIASVTSNTITLTTDLGDSLTLPGTPDVVARDGYTLRDGSRVWVENPAGLDWRASFTSSAWSSGTPRVLNITSALADETGGAAGVTDPVGKRVYIRRLVDTRTPEQRRYSLKLNSLSSLTRVPVRDYVLQTTYPGTGINRALTTSEVLTVATTSKIPATGVGVVTSAQVSLRRSTPTNTWTSGTLYRKGDTATRNNKHYTCIAQNSDTVFTEANWQESYVHMPEAFHPEDFYRNEAPILTFDNDTDGTQNSTTLGYTLSTVWSTDALIQAQYRTAADYRGMHALLTALGFSSGDAHTILTPKAEASRDRDPSSSSDMGGLSPSGGAASGRGNWPIEFRRPSIIRLFGHAWEWAGYLNYTKALPLYQKDLSDWNRFTYYFTNQSGGRVYATGFNEEGYQVTPRGLEDISTGETLTVENLGSTTDLLSSTTLNDVTLRGATTISDTLNINASTTFGSQSFAKTNRAGVGRIASVSEISNNEIVGSSDALLNQGDTKFVTLEGLEYWKADRKLLSARAEATAIYVVPDNATAGASVTFRGIGADPVTTTLSSAVSPDRTGNDLQTYPPTSTGYAVTFRRAVEYANLNFSSLETVNYYLADGPYWQGTGSGATNTWALTFNHIANIYGATQKFPKLDVVPSNAGDSGTTVTPTTDVKSISDSYAIPCFATSLLTGTNANTSPKRLNFAARPLRLRLAYGGSIQGICWKSTLNTLADSSGGSFRFPNDIYPSDMQAGRTVSYVGSLAAFIKQYIENNQTLWNSNYNIDKFYGFETIRVDSGDLIVQDCIFGAKAPGLGIIGYGSLGPIVMVGGTSGVVIRGVYLLGNSVLQSTDSDIATYLSGKGITVTSSAVYGIRNTQCFVASREANVVAKDFSVRFDYRYEENAVSGAYQRNFNGNCIHVLNNAGNYGTLTTKAATDGTRGATMQYLFGEMASGSRFYTGGFSSYQRSTSFTRTGMHHGFAGVFGNDSSSAEGPIGISAPTVSNGLPAPLQMNRHASYNGSVWQQANSGTAVRYSGTPVMPGAGKSVVAYTASSDNVLNIKSSIFQQGLDVETGNVVGGSLESVTISAVSYNVLFC